MKSRNICSECNGTGYTHNGHLQICNACYGLGKPYRQDNFLIQRRREANIVILILGFMLAALILSTGQLKMKWVLIVVGVYMWIMMGSIASFFASIPARIRHIIVH